MTRFILRLILVPLLCTAAVLSAFSPGSAADLPPEGLLPKSCAPGWAMEDKVATYTPETLYRYINGEAELYLPYGFKKASTVRYVEAATSSGGPQENGIVVNLFEMGSPLDAFGIYSNYRSSTLPPIKTGAEGFFDETELMFYQDRYFVQIQTSGTLNQEAVLFQSCAEAVSGNLPGGREKPREIEFLKIAGAVPLTEKYYAQGLLGYSFFGKGLTVEVTIKGEPAKALVILAGSEEVAKRILDEYGKYLKEAKAVPQISRETKGTSLQVIDPLFKGTALHQSGPFVVGVVGLKDPQDGDGIVGQLLKRLPDK
jgi:hypothetical protein